MGDPRTDRRTHNPGLRRIDEPLAPSSTSRYPLISGERKWKRSIRWVGATSASARPGCSKLGGSARMPSLPPPWRYLDTIQRASHNRVQERDATGTLQDQPLACHVRRQLHGHSNWLSHGPQQQVAPHFRRSSRALPPVQLLEFLPRFIAEPVKPTSNVVGALTLATAALTRQLLSSMPRASPTSSTSS